MNQKRIEAIDVLRGITMALVVSRFLMPVNNNIL